MLVKVIEEIFCQTTAVEEETVPIHTFLNAPCGRNGSPERLHDLQGVGRGKCVYECVCVCTNTYMHKHTHTYIIYLSLLSKSCFPED